MYAPNEGYFHWLAGQTGVPQSPDPRQSFWTLLHQLHLKQFTWTVRNDDNRGEAGLELREEYERAYDIEDEDLWVIDQASVLEVLVALARCLEFETEIPTRGWFWKLLENIGVHHYCDAFYDAEVERDVDHILEKVLKRRYAPDGTGGLFPLRHADRDQRRIELWYQMSAYLAEGHVVEVRDE